MSIRNWEANFLLQKIRTEFLHTTGESIFSPSIARRIRQHFDNPSSTAAFPELTERELETLELLAQGLTNPAIAERLSLSVKTVRNRVSDIFSKLHVSDRAGAILKARDAGLGQ
jgi:DNA-binding NarL/FixJ family response regulator